MEKLTNGNESFIYRNLFFICYNFFLAFYICAMTIFHKLNGTMWQRKVSFPDNLNLL